MAMFSNDDVGNAFAFSLRIVHIIAMDKHNNIGVIFK